MGDYKNQNSIPKFGLKVNLNHVYPENRSQEYVPTLKQLWVLLPLILRYIVYYIISKITGKSIVMDYVKVQRAKQIYGVPLGGIGSGTIGRGYRGEFCRFQLKPGVYEHNTIDANQFIITIKEEHNETIFHSLLSTFPKKTLLSWESHINGSNCFYTGLYPRSWTQFDLSKYGIKLTCRQISPVIPNNYTDSCLPCAVFVWDIQNVSNSTKTVTIAFTFKNGTGTNKQDRNSTCSSKMFSYNSSEGVLLYHTINKLPCTYALSVNSKSDISVSRCPYFDPNSDGSKPWLQLKNNGAFDEVTDKFHEHVFGEMACGVAAKLTLLAGNSRQVEMNLVWDMPTITFPENDKKHVRYYSQIFGIDNSILKIVDYAFQNYEQWEKEIFEWQNPVLENDDLPDWFKGALFNESYYLSDGGSIWLSLDQNEIDKLPTNDPRRKFGRFAYLEGHEYRMYNTYDVHFYASCALYQNFPMLQYSLQYDMRDAIFTEIPDKMKMLYDGKYVERKKPNTVPHDIGDPNEEPFVLLNSYPIHDVSEWRDLNTKFVLQVFRDGYSDDVDKCKLDYLVDMYDACFIVMDKTLEFDQDGDGLIENGGTPDQTFDAWIMEGPSAYCGGLWLAALFAMIKMAHVLHKDADEIRFADILARGKKAFERKLWNGNYYQFDCSQTECDSIMADQLCGHWFLRSCGYKYELFPYSNVVKTLKTIYENNVMSFCNGTMGAVNGFINGDADPFAIQSVEVWTGVTYALAATMIYEDMREEAFKTAGGMYRSLTEKLGLAFDTPEALYAEKYYRSIGYMRPLSIWSIYKAILQTDKQKRNQ